VRLFIALLFVAPLIIAAVFSGSKFTPYFGTHYTVETDIWSFWL